MTQLTSINDLFIYTFGFIYDDILYTCIGLTNIKNYILFNIGNHKLICPTFPFPHFMELITLVGIFRDHKTMTHNGIDRYNMIDGSNWVVASRLKRA